MKFAEVIKSIPGDVYLGIKFNTDDFVYARDYAIKFRLSGLFDQYDVIEVDMLHRPFILVVLSKT